MAVKEKDAWYTSKIDPRSDLKKPEHEFLDSTTDSLFIL
jgi:hypothetical protein